MAYIMMIGILMGLIVPIWSIAQLGLQVLQTIEVSKRQQRGERVVVESLMKKRAIIYLRKRLLRNPRMPCETTKLIN